MTETQHNRSHHRDTGALPGGLTAGMTLLGIDSLGSQDTFTRQQVAYIVSLAFWSGTHVRTLADAAEIAAAAGANFEPRPTREQRIALRIAEMERADELVRLRRACRQPPPFRPEQPRGLMTHTPGGRRLPEPREVDAGEPVDPDVQWPEVAAPGSGRPKW